MVCVPIEVSDSAKPVTMYGTTASGSNAQPNTGSCGSHSSGISRHSCNSCAGTSPSSSPASMPANKPSNGANSRKVLLSQTLQPTIVANVSKPTNRPAPETGAPSSPLPKISRKPKCPSPKPISSTATPETSTVNTLRMRMMKKLKTICDSPTTQTMPNTVASVAPGRLATKYIAGSTAPVACSG